MDLPLFNPVSGPGSQPAEADGAELDILQLPSGMQTYSMPVLPEPEQVNGLDQALQVLGRLQQRLQSYPASDACEINLAGLDPSNIDLVNQVLGEGEVSILVNDDREIRVQESVLAGVWRVRLLDHTGSLVSDSIDVGPVPGCVLNPAMQGRQSLLTMPDALPPGVLNAPPLLSEINAYTVRYQPGEPTSVINLTLLPQTEADLLFLQHLLGPGRITILSRGYGNCRITSTDTANVWWVQYFNSQDRNILNTLEITQIPEVACAAPEDIADSAERLAEILALYQ